MEGLSLPLWCRNRIERVDNRQFSFQNFPYIEQYYNDKSRRKCAEKSEQMGFTVNAISESFHGTWTGLNWGYYFPTEKMVKAFVESRYNVLINANPKLKELIRNTDNTRIKNIGAGIIYFFGLGSGSEQGGELATFSNPMDAVTFDEYEKMKPEFAKMALGRIARSPHKLERYISTPGLSDYGIDGKLKESDQKYWTMKCPHCNEWNVVDDIDEEGNPIGFPACIEQGYLSCSKCRLDLRQYSAAEWVPKHPDLAQDMSGYHVSQLYSPLADLRELLKDWGKLQTTRQKKNYFNFKLGLPYADLSTALTKAAVLKLCRRDRGAEKSEGCFMGIDIGGSKKGIHIVIGKPGPPMFRIEHMEVLREPDPQDPKAQEWICGQIGKLIVRYGVKKFGVDAMPEQRLSRAIVYNFSRKGWMVRYNDNQKGPYQWGVESDEREVQVNRTESLDNSHYLLQKGFISLPMRDDIVEEFAEHCENLVRDEEMNEDTGVIKYVWKRKSNKQDDFRHAFNYFAIAAGFDGTPELKATPGTVILGDDPAYRPKYNRSGGIKIEW